ncbi:hypothetical protein LDENG_00029960 [Lucifuga dentata]|nr:hypothetical protein LDENG_00029960 [Lucifuga dentata]
MTHGPHVYCGNIFHVNFRMSLFDQMKLIELSLTLITLISNTNGQDWDVSVNPHITATLHSDVNIPCNFTYPPSEHTGNVQVYWKMPQKSKFHVRDRDLNAFIFHPNDTYVLSTYKGKTRLTGDISKGSCSLLIQDVTQDVRRIYLRISTGKNFYSFRKHTVSIHVSGLGIIPVSVIPDESITIMPEVTQMAKNPQTSTLLYVYIFVPIAAVLIIILFAGIIFHKKPKRHQSLTREESGYYINFSRPSSSQAKREASGKNQDSKQLSQPKDTDDPVYANVQYPTGCTGSVDQTDNIYVNANVSKL